MQTSKAILWFCGSGIATAVAAILMVQSSVTEPFATAILSPGPAVVANCVHAPCASSHTVDCNFWNVINARPALLAVGLLLDILLYAATLFLVRRIVWSRISAPLKARLCTAVSVLVLATAVVLDLRLALAFQRGEMERLVVDRSEDGVVKEAHLTQMPSKEDALILSLWAAFNVCGGAVAWRWVSRRRGYYSPTSTVRQP